MDRGLLVLSPFSALLLLLAQPPFHFILLPFTALVPLVVALEGVGAHEVPGRRAAWMGLIMGACYWGVLLLWVPMEVGPRFSWAYPGYLGQVGLLSGLMALMAWSTHALRATLPLPLALPLAWVSMEWLKGHFPLGLSFPWLGLGISLTSWPQALGLAEWGLNYAIAQHAHQYLMLHAAVVERDGRTIIMPGQPGSGKSTLCAALLGQGWRLLSDEFALLSPEDGQLTPLPRPVSIKNAAIDLIRTRMPDAVIGPIATDTAKGTVAHLKAPLDSVRRADERATPAWLVFPEYDAAASETVLAPLSKGRSLMAAAESSFNYDVLGVTGFETVADLVDRCDCYTLTYHDLDEALARIADLTAASPVTSA